MRTVSLFVGTPAEEDALNRLKIAVYFVRPVGGLVTFNWMLCQQLLAGEDVTQKWPLGAALALSGAMRGRLIDIFGPEAARAFLSSNCSDASLT